MLIEVLSTLGDDSPTFTVNTGALSVPMSIAVGDGLLYNAASNSIFNERDHFILLSFGIRLPLGFEIFYDLNGAIESPTYITLEYKDGAGLHDLNPPVCFLPWSNYELNYGRFFEMPDTDGNFQLASNIYDQLPQVSMVGVPASLDAETYQCPIFWKVGHTLPLTGGV